MSHHHPPFLSHHGEAPSALAPAVPADLKPAAPIQFAPIPRSGLAGPTSILALPLVSDLAASAESDETDSTWGVESVSHRPSSPELDTDISRTSSTSTKVSAVDVGAKPPMLAAEVAPPLATKSLEHYETDSDKDLTPTQTHPTTLGQLDEPKAPSSDLAQVALKRLHSLLEFADTEQNYVSDLDILIRVYFRQLRTVPYFAEMPSRYATVARNAPELLSLHTELSHRLTLVIERYELRGEAGEPAEAEVERALRLDVPQAVVAMAQAFIDLASHFEVYYEFCAKHKEALALISAAETRSEWEAFQAAAAGMARRSRQTSEARTSSVDTSVTSTRQRLLFRDFFIKPIQRVCLYPILLQNLLKYAPPAGVPVMNEAILCMRRVLVEVDDASAKRASAQLTETIVSRVEPSLDLPSSLLPSLGECKMAGNLDVLYHHVTKAPLTIPLAFKYYGCFLYKDFFIMVKVRKNHMYSPRFWFPLAEVTIARGDDGRVCLPQSFRLSVRGHHFEMVASTEKERVIWLHALDTVMAAGPARTRRLNGMELPFPCNLTADTTPSAAQAKEQAERVDPLALYLNALSFSEADAARAGMPTTVGSPTEVLLRHKTPLRRAAKDRGMVFSDACISARSSLDGDWARSHGTVVGSVTSRVGLHRLSGSETFSLKLSTGDVTPAETGPASSSSTHTESDEPQGLRTSASTQALLPTHDASTTPSYRPSKTALTPKRSFDTDLRQSGSATARSTSTEPSLSSSRSSLSLARPRALVSRKLGWLSPTTTRPPVSPEELSSALSDVMAQTPKPSLLRHSASMTWSPISSLSTRVRRSSMDAIVYPLRSGSVTPSEFSLSTSSSSHPTPTMSTSASDTVSSPTESRPSSPRRRSALRFLQRNRLSTMDHAP